MTTTEYCPHCEDEVIIDSDNPDTCSSCKSTILPCSTCKPLEKGKCLPVGNKGGCTRFPDHIG